jgi:hypothetical protein
MGGADAGTRRDWTPLGKNEAIVRCSAGHIYRTIWWRWGSFKAARLGVGLRFQHCPVGHHWALTRRVDVASLSADELAEAARNHDSGIW